MRPAPEPRPRAPLVVVINAGGTISMSEDGVPGDAVAALLRGGLAGLRVRAVAAFDRPPDSSNVAEPEWARLLAVIQAAIGEPGDPPAGVVITHGTDTMAFSATLIALELGPALALPIVFTGAHSPPGVPGSDALPNFVSALRVAAGLHEEPAPPGVYVLIGVDLHLASRLTKVGTRPDADGRYFFSFPEPVGQLHRGGQQLKLGERLLERMRAPSSGVWPSRRGPLGVAELLVLDPFCGPGSLADAGRRLRAAQAEGRRAGLVIQGNFCRSAALPALRALLIALCEDGVLVMLGSKATHEVLPAHPLLGLLHKSLSHQTARLKLAWLLGTDADDAALRAWMDESLVGEIYETIHLPQWIRYETWPEQRPGLELVVAWPGMPPAVIADAAARLGDEGKRTLVLFGFGHGHLPGPNLPLSALVGPALCGPAGWGFALALDEGDGPELILAKLLPHVAAPSLRPRLLARYAPAPALLRTAWTRLRLDAATAADRAALRAGLHAPLEALLGAQPRLLHAEGLAGRLLDEALRAARFAPPALPPLPDLEHDPADLIFAALQASAPELLARRLLRDALAEAHPLCAAVGEAVDRGARVLLRTTAQRGQTDNRAYEAGRMLSVLGAHSDRAQGWDTRALRRR